MGLFVGNNHTITLARGNKFLGVQAGRLLAVQILTGQAISALFLHTSDSQLQATFLRACGHCQRKSISSSPCSGHPLVTVSGYNNRPGLEFIARLLLKFPVRLGFRARLHWSDRTSESSSERSSDRAIERSRDRASERSSERSIERAIERESDRSIERSIGRAIERATDRASVQIDREGLGPRACSLSEIADFLLGTSVRVCQTDKTLPWAS